MRVVVWISQDRQFVCLGVRDEFDANINGFHSRNAGSVSNGGCVCLARGRSSRSGARNRCIKRGANHSDEGIGKSEHGRARMERDGRRF